MESETLEPSRIEKPLRQWSEFELMRAFKDLDEGAPWCNSIAIEIGRRVANGIWEGLSPSERFALAE